MMFPKTSHTITLKTLLDSGIDIGLKDYPIWDEEYRTILNKKIINHYYLREIGQETPGLFIHYLNMTMNEVMPYYNELYKTTVYEYNPLNSADYTIEYTKEIKGEQKGSSEGTGLTTGESSSESNSSSTTQTNGNSKSARVDTPQTVLEVNDIDNLNVATELNFAKQNGEDKTTNTSSGSSNDKSSTTTSSSNEATNNETEVFKQHLVGDYGVKSTQALIKEQREILINVDNMIIAELNSCFMLIH